MSKIHIKSTNALNTVEKKLSHMKVYLKETQLNCETFIIS